MAVETTSGGPLRSENELLAAVAAGDTSAFSQLYERVSRRVYGVVRRILHDSARSEEVAQEVLVEIWRTAARFDPTRGEATTWMMVMAHRRAIDRLRSQQASRDRDRRVALREPPAPFDEVAEEVESRSEHERVRAALALLTKLQREAITLAYFGGRTYRETAELLDLPLGTVKTRIRDGLQRLGTLMAPGGAAG